jgi:hypothetical protein
MKKRMEQVLQESAKARQGEKHGKVNRKCSL